MTDPLKVYTPYIGQDPPGLNAPQVNNPPPYAWSFVEHDNSSEKLGIVFLPAFVLDSGARDGVKPTTNLYHNDIWRDHQDKIPSENMMCSVQVTLSQEYSPGTSGDGSCIWFDKNKTKKSQIEIPGQETNPPPVEHWPVFQHTFFPSFDPIQVHTDKDTAGKDYFYFKKDEISDVLDPKGSSELVLDPQISPLPIIWNTKDKDIPLWDESYKPEQIKEHLLGLIKEGGMVILNFKKWHAFAIKDNYMEWYEDGLSFNSGSKGEPVLQSDGTIDPDDIWNKDNLHQFDIRKTYEGIVIAKPIASAQNPGEDLLIEPCPLKMYPDHWDGTRSPDENNEGQYFEYDQNNQLQAKPLDDVTDVFFPVLDSTDHPFPGFDYLHGYVKINKASGVMELSITNSRSRGKIPLISNVLSDGSKNANQNANYPFFPTFSLTRHNDSYYEAVLKLNLNLTSDVKTLIKTAFEERADDPRRTSTDSINILKDAENHGVSYFRQAPVKQGALKKGYRAFAFIPEKEVSKGGGVIKDLYPDVNLPSWTHILENEYTYIGWVNEPNTEYYYFVAVFYDEDWNNNFAGEHVVTDPLFKSWCLDAMEDYNTLRKADSDYDPNDKLFNIDELEINSMGVIETSHWKIPAYSFVSALSPKCYLKSGNNPKVADKDLVISKPLTAFNHEKGKHIS